MPKKIYVASSWRNPKYPEVVAALRGTGLDVYDFRNPVPGDDGFHWSQIDPKWQSWSAAQYRRHVMTHPLAEAGFGRDMAALGACDAAVLILPCGRSAHLELGWAKGAGKRTGILMAPAQEPELMYRMVDDIWVDLPEMLSSMAAWAKG